VYIPPKRRRRALKVHYLRQLGHPLRKIGEQLQISHSTVRSDLQLAETHWGPLAAAAADDLLLQSLQLLQIRLSIAIKNDDFARLGEHLTPADYLRARNDQETQFNALAREIRRTANDVRQRAEQRADQPGLIQDELHDDRQEDTELAETTSQSSTTIQPEPASPLPEQQIDPADASEEKIPAETVQIAPPAGFDQVLNEAIQLFPHLKGLPQDQILQFLDQLTDPAQETGHIPPEIYADAAG
jgi:hypothetical protein